MSEPFLCGCGAAMQAMQEYILGYLQDFEATLFSPSYADPASGWRKLANGSSAIDYFLFEVRIKQQLMALVVKLLRSGAGIQHGWLLLNENVIAKGKVWPQNEMCASVDDSCAE